jgi:hypothetical protein
MNRRALDWSWPSAKSLRGLPARAGRGAPNVATDARPIAETSATRRERGATPETTAAEAAASADASGRDASLETEERSRRDGRRRATGRRERRGSVARAPGRGIDAVREAA